jgi:hypothetical protein
MIDLYVLQNITSLYQKETFVAYYTFLYKFYKK